MITFRDLGSVKSELENQQYVDGQSQSMKAEQ